MINKIHERALRVILNDYESDFETLLTKNIQTLSIEIFKIKKGFAPLIIRLLLKGRNNTYNVRQFQEFETERKRAVYFGLETIT